jgi:hypothetical protein
VSDAYLAMIRLEAAGVEMVLLPDGRMRWRAADQPPDELVAEARQHRDAIRELLRIRLAEPHRLPERGTLA